MILSLLFNVVNFLSFLSGIAFGLFLCFVAAVHFLSDQTQNLNTSDTLNSPPAIEKKPPNENEVTPLTVASTSATQIHGNYVPQKLSKSELGRLNSIIEVLDEMNSPLKNIGSVLERIHLNKEQENASLEAKMKTIIEYSAVNKLEKEFQDAMTQLKDHAKQTKLISNFLYDLGKVFSSFSRDVSKLSHTARNNMNKSSQSLDRKEDMIANNWWQTLQIALDSMANDQEDLSTIISEELINYSNQIQEEISIIEKRLTAEGNKHFTTLREHLNVFENRLKEREKAKDKLRNTPIQASPSSNATGTSDSYQRRAQRLKASDDMLVVQTKKLYEIQKEFYLMIPRIHSDVQLTILKSIVETQSQLLKLTDGIDRIQNSNKSVCARMKTQLTNAASSLVQMIREESTLLPDVENVASVGTPSPASLALQVMKQRMLQAGAKGYELTLQKVLEGLLIQSQLKNISATTRDIVNGTNTASTGLNIPVAAYTNGSMEGDKGLVVSEDLSHLHILEDLGKLDMFQEATACLAASNPYILPELPRSFATAIGTETCVWFNAFGGRVYRDIANSQYFHKWFCTKLAQMLNKKGKNERPAYIDKFEVTEVSFGELPPLLLNVKWSPHLKKRGASNNDVKGEKPRRSKSGEGKPSSFREEKDVHKDDSVEKDQEDDNDSASEGSAEEAEDEDAEDQHEEVPEHHLPSADRSEDNQFYAACTADMAFRSGLKFTVSTKLWINWPRDRYASVPVIFYLDLSELSGRIRFGVERSYSFLSFLKNPTTRISVRSEVGGDKYKLKDIPQISDFIVKKLKKFIQKKIVHPHSHKFRLIWPRNWWPEGTEDLFLPTDQPSGSRPASPVPAHRVTETKTPVANAVPVPVEGALGDPEAVPASKQLMDATNKLMNKARTFNFTSASNTTSVKSTTTSTPVSAKPVAVNKGETSENSEEHVREISENSYQLKEARWMQHLRDATDRSADLIFPTVRALPAQEKRRIENQFYLKQKKRKIAIPTSRATTSQSRSRGSSNAQSLSSEKKEIATKKKVVRSLSIGDFRPLTVDVILDGVLDRMQTKIMDSVDIARRSSFSGLTNDDAIHVNRQHSAPRLNKRSNSIYVESKADESNNTGWLTAKSREAKAKFLEFKNKHFGQGKEKSSSTHGGGVGAGGGSASFSNSSSGAGDLQADIDLDKAYKSAARIGGKIKDFFQKIGDEGEVGTGSSSIGSNRRLSGRSSFSLSPVREEEALYDKSSKSPDDGVRQRRGSDADPVLRSADVGLDESTHHQSTSSVKGSTMKFMASMFRSSGSATHSNDTERSSQTRTLSTDAGIAASKESRVNAMLNKALSSVRSQAEKEKDKE
mmetsp:Transcript_13452/g.14612  ORF Transcript_13452/g.14612 Transcript_13452/m.14612 type:complete len:1345 (+) Transcript_13452:203-4237(+)|eukprot:CAMPEP_0173161440 /NCGR_PEP_ID=MMETSP1105-20130129/18596_1 /TAXON_ID=2985 /ORGANISM="Ochromonas sp., Strain BG-1" /LENGTH=1344 /DNA_ID=CAMNT_0014080845 /DNA_START=120 /DNA_END=4154 /DNA_ORIENTATION=-